ncbi:sulfite exporter TauE/SafE [Gottschalkia purinilytica]|uniref:Probable membrane transporter protein n=1 Tax=Gottschalkia purinilytica TaxID=1503 RepID=A0A0L0W7Z9_GOTPU|nr:TSUP family transporter [Gottschalkia purinilytica]KNF07562.1 sulfite exporter TauE/SafE [Gottschalkia purinilytica]
MENPLFVIIIGFVTATICSLTGSGGPILVVPILVNLGMNIKVAVGISLFNSIIIALPSSLGYLSQSNFKGMIIFVIISLTAHVIGILIGAKISNKINLNILTKIVSIVSISSSLYMLILALI